MDRTIIAPYRAEERELSQLLFNKLQGLALLHPMSEELKKFLSDEMFIKPNQQAFFHIMHYLFRLIDHNEFKKRFYWPITDKRSESNFRTSTVEYLKYLNEKHQLHWANIKSYLVVMPGGMKFISFLLEFVHFIVKELIKQKEKQLSLDASQQQAMTTEENLQKICKKDSLFKEMAAAFIDSIDVINRSRQTKLDIIARQLSELAATTDGKLEHFANDIFLSDFEGRNVVLFEQQFESRTNDVFLMEMLVMKLKKVMDTFFSKETGFKCDKNKLRLQLKILREFLVENFIEAALTSDDSISVNTLIKTFNGIIESVQNELTCVDKRPCTGIVHTGLLAIKNDLQDIEKQITDFLMVIKSKKKKRTDFVLQTPVRSEAFIKKSAAGPNGCLENTFLMKYVATPPIKLEYPSGQYVPSRLSLFDSKVAGNIANTFASFLAPSRNARQTKLNNSAVEQSAMDLDNTMNKSKLIDPMQLLRSINKDTSKLAITPKTNISSLGSKWKERQSLFMDKEHTAAPIILSGKNDSPIKHTIQKSASDIEISLSIPPSVENEINISNCSTLVKKSFVSSGSSVILQSPMTPFSSNDHTRVARSQLHLLETKPLNKDGGVINLSASNVWSCYKKMSAVRKVQDASVNFANLSTSPSGRLEPLVTAQDFNIPKLKLNDLSLIDHNLNINKSFDDISNDFDISVLGTTEQPSKDCIAKSEKINYPEGEDAICNVSDSILKDVTM